jgi:glucose-1-phosphate adenylyltransferase
MDKETTAEVIRAMNISESVLGVILGGGAGSRLYPLTKTRAKPAVPLGANYRLIDIPVSNCLNSGITKVYTLTQFNSASLNRHLSTSYNSNMGSFGGRGFVEVLAASQTTTNPGWFQGTADAVRQYLWLFEEAIERGVEDLCILSGDHLYRMDYSRFVAAHRQAGAAITVAALPCDEARASAFGLMKIDDTGRIVEFAEKPKGDALRAMRVDTTVLGLDAARAAEQPYIASMGIYIANARLMRDLLLEHFPDAHDFGGEIIPGATARGEVVQAYLFDGYWEDIGTIKSFYESNLALTGTNPTFSFFDKEAPVYTASRFLPPSKVLRAEVTDSIVGDGCLIREGAVVTHSVLGVRGTVGRDARVIDAVVMGADYYETQADLAAGSGVPLGVGDGSTVRGAILDKNVRVGRNCEIVNAGKVQEADRESEGFVIKDGIIVVCKDTVLADGTKI